MHNIWSRHPQLLFLWDRRKGAHDETFELLGGVVYDVNGNRVIQAPGERPGNDV
jgi:hypothetical protein